MPLVHSHGHRRMSLKSIVRTCTNLSYSVLLLPLLNTDNVHHIASNGGSGTEESRVEQAGGEDETGIQYSVVLASRANFSISG